MKIRLGFISNSSSTSFCMYGIYVPDAKELMKKFKMEVDDIYLLEEDSDISVFDVEYDGIYIGGLLGGESEHCLLTSAQREDETLREFRARIEKILTDKLGTEDTQCETLATSWQ